MDPQKISELANLLRNKGDKILSSEFTLTLSGSLLRALNDAFTLIADSLEVDDSQNFQVVKPINSKPAVFRDLQLIHDFVQKTALLSLVHYPGDEYNGRIDITKFRVLKRLELQKVNVMQVIGIQRLRNQLEHVICVKSLKAVDDIITHCGGDNSNGFVWNELKIADFSYNNLKCVDTSLEFAQYLQHLNLRHNKLESVEAIKWLPNLKTLDLSFNLLVHIPQFHMDACKRLQSLNMSNNLLEDLMGIMKLDALTDLDLSDNCILDHTYLLPLSALMTLKFLNLYGNPLHCHPKHRLVTAQFLHKNCSTVKFVLDFDTLSKSEKAATGTHKLRQVGALNRYNMRSSPSQISAGAHSATTATPSSSVSSLISYRLPVDSSSESEAMTAENATTTRTRKKANKIRYVEIEECQPEKGDMLSDNESAAATSTLSTKKSIELMANTANTEHLETKQKIVELREKYGNEWLHSGNAEMRSSFLGHISSSPAIDVDLERQRSRDILKDYIKDVSEDVHSPSLVASTPTNHTLDTAMSHLLVSPIKQPPTASTTDSSLYESLDQSQTLINVSNDANGTNSASLYKSLDDTEPTKRVKNTNPFECDDDDGLTEANKSATEQATASKSMPEEDDHLKYVYSTNEVEEEEVSDPEDDEEVFTVYANNQNEAIFLTKSNNFLRERDPLTEKTKTKWSLKMMESCERIKSNTLRINFDTVKVDKQERIYTLEESVCQELQKKLRDILSQRELTEMNQVIYRCLNCNCQFSQEIKKKSIKLVIHCPDCKSTFVAEIHDIPKSLNKSGSLANKLSPASIVEEMPMSLASQASSSVSEAADLAEDSNSIGSANSLYDSSCSKITSNSDSSFNSNQSLVGSSNTDRDLDFKANGESDVDIISNPSQSSIEVLDHYASRKTSEERRVSHMPNLETIDDQSYTQTFLEREFENMINFAMKDKAEVNFEVSQQIQQPTQQADQSDSAKDKPKPSANILTESSSSGSVTDSICTTYEQKAANEAGAKEISNDFIHKESNGNAAGNKEAANMKADNNGLSSMFGALIQTTNNLMSSSKKLIESETISGSIMPTSTTTADNATRSSPDAQVNQDASTSMLPLYKFNYTDFNDIDHRLKLYFYQTKFEEKEHFKWIVRGQIYNDQTKQLCCGCVILSTCKLYVMEAFAAENEDVGKWLRPLITCTVDRLETIQLLPWKIGLSFHLRGWGRFLLLLQDILRTDSLLLFFANNSLPSPCELKYQPNEKILKRLNSSVMEEQLNMCSVLNGCEISCENAKRSFNTCCLLTTDSRLYLSSQKLGWLLEPAADDAAPDGDNDIELCVTQFMSNLVEVEHCAGNVIIINFLDETQDKCELWRCTFETKDNATTCLTAIGESWEKLFGVPLMSA